MADRDSRWVIEVQEAGFASEVLERSASVPVVVDFTAGWCGPCQVLGPILERLAEEYQGRFILAKVDYDRNPYLAAQFGVQSIPTVLGFVDGRIAGHFIGALPEEQVRQFLGGLLPSAADVALKRAAEVVESGPEEALRLLDEAAEGKPDSEDAAALRARALLRLGRDAEARRAAEQVTEASARHQEAANVLAILRFRDEAKALGKQATEPAKASAWDHYAKGIGLAAEGNYPAALQELLSAGERDPKLATGNVKEAMVSIFQLLGPDSELADNYRGRLAALLY